MKTLILPALVAACLSLALPGMAFASGAGQQHGKPAESHRQPHCPPGRAQAPHPRASDVPFRADNRTRHHACDTRPRHSFLHRHFHRQRH